MKILLVLVMLLVACAPKFTIPDPPKFKPISIYQMEGLACFDQEGAGVLKYNISLLREYADKMRKILEDLKK